MLQDRTAGQTAGPERRDAFITRCSFPGVSGSAQSDQVWPCRRPERAGGLAPRSQTQMGSLQVAFWAKGGSVAPAGQQSGPSWLGRLESVSSWTHPFSASLRPVEFWGRTPPVRRFTIEWSLLTLCPLLLGWTRSGKGGPQNSFPTIPQAQGQGPTGIRMSGH